MTHLPEIVEQAIDCMKDYNGPACDFHNRAFNEDYFIVGAYEAKEWLEKSYGIFEAVEKIREYEQSNFGEVNTDLSSPENVANMLAYILGEELLSDSEILQEHWDEDIDEEIAKKIIAELEEL